MHEMGVHMEVDQEGLSTRRSQPAKISMSLQKSGGCYTVPQQNSGGGGQMGIFPSTNSLALNASTSSTDIPYFLLKSSLDRELGSPLSGPVSAASVCSDKVQRSGAIFGADVL